jgi:geranylgeranyl pyrophosphate synthase
VNFAKYLENCQNRVNHRLTASLPNADTEPEHLHSAMRYAVLNGGKRIRPLLVYATGEAFGVELSLLDSAACAVEFIHAYSLVHDDLPAMDNDDLRRGLPTCHKAYDEATAILVGDALQALAFQILADQTDTIDPTIRLNMVSRLSAASGSLGMVGGQALDLKATGKKLHLQQVEKIHRLKTGALIRACVQLGLLTANIHDPHILAKMHEYATCIGLCFQIQDDILDIEGQTLILGKRSGVDSAKHKVTYPSTEGLKNAKLKLQQFHQQALMALECVDLNTGLLQMIADYIVNRNN